MNQSSANPGFGPSVSAYQLSSLLEAATAFSVQPDIRLLLSSPAQMKTAGDSESEVCENKENVSPCDTACSMTTPLKPPTVLRARPLLSSSERTPLSDISHHFGPKRKRLEVTWN